MSLFIISIKFGLPSTLPEVANFPLTYSEFILFGLPSLFFSLISSILLLFTLLFFLKHKHSYCSHYINIILPLLWCALAFISFLGFIKATCLDYAYLQCIYMLGLAAFSLFIFRVFEINHKDTSYWVVFTIFLSTMLISIYGIYQYHIGFENTRQFLLDSGIKTHGNFHGRLYDNLVYSVFALSNSFAGHLILVIPISIWFVYKYLKNKTLNYTSTILTSILLFYTLFITGSRAAILSFFIACIFLFFILPFRKRIKIFVLLISLILVCMCFVFFSRKGFGSFEIRLDYFNTTFIMMKQNLLTGAGWGEFFYNYNFMKLYPSAESPHMPHNFILSMGSQAGIFAFLLSLAIIIIPITFAIKKLFNKPKDKILTNIAFPLLLGWIAWSIHSLLDVNIQIPSTCAIAITITALLFKPNSNKENISHLGSKNKPFIFPLLWILISMSIILLTLTMSIKRMKGDASYQNLNNQCSTFNMTTLSFKKEPIPMENINTTLMQCTTLMPYSPYPWAIAGQVALKRKKWILAEKYFKEATINSSKSAGFYYYLALSQFKQNKRALARKNLNKAAILHPFIYEKYATKQPLKTEDKRLKIRD